MRRNKIYNLLIFLLVVFSFTSLIQYGQAECIVKLHYSLHHKHLEVIVEHNGNEGEDHPLACVAIYNDQGYDYVDTCAFGMGVDYNAVLHEPADNWAVNISINAEPFQKITFRIYCLTCGSLSSSTTVGEKEILYPIYTASGILVFIGLSIFASKIYRNKYLPIRQTEQFQKKLEDAKQTAENGEYEKALVSLNNLLEEIGIDYDNAIKSSIDNLIIHCNNSIYFISQHQKFMKLYEQGDFDSSYKGLIDLAKHFDSPEFKDLFDPSIRNKIMESLKKITRDQDQKSIMTCRIRKNGRN